MRRRLVRGLAVGVASGALVLAPMAAAASAGELDPGLIWEFDRTDPGERPVDRTDPDERPVDRTGP